MWQISDIISPVWRPEPFSSKWLKGIIFSPGVSKHLPFSHEMPSDQKSRTTNVTTGLTHKYVGHPMCNTSPVRHRDTVLYTLCHFCPSVDPYDSYKGVEGRQMSTPHPVRLPTESTWSRGRSCLRRPNLFTENSSNCRGPHTSLPPAPSVEGAPCLPAVNLPYCKHLLISGELIPPPGHI